MKKNRFLLLLIILHGFAASAQVSTSLTPMVEKGVIDLSEWDFETDGIVKLDGEWEFYWQQLVPSSGFDNNTLVPDTFLYIPHSWTNAQIHGTPIPGIGYATYRMRLLIPDNVSLLYLKVIDISTAYSLWINNQRVANAGTVSVTDEGSEGQFKFYIIPLEIDQLISDGQPRELSFVMHVSNYMHKNGGLWQPLLLGTQSQITHAWQNSIMITLLLSGIILIMALYHFGLFFLRRSETSFLYFALLAFFMFIRSMSVNDRPLLFWFPDMSLELLSKLEYSSYSASALFMVLFFYELFKADFHKRLVQFFVVSVSAYLAIIVFAPLMVYSSTKDFFNIIILLGGVYSVFYVLIKAMIHRREGAIIAFVGMFIFLITGTLDLLKSIQIIYLPYMMPWGLLVYIFAQSFLLSKRYSNSFVRNEELTVQLNYQNQNLEKIVWERTAEIEQQKEEILTQSENLRSANQDITSYNKELEQQKEEVARQNKEIERAYRNIKLLSEIGQKITGNLSVETIIDTVYSHVNKLMDAAIFAIGVYNTKKQQIEFSGSIEKGEKLPDQIDKLSDDIQLSVRCFKSQEVIYIKNLHEEFKDYFQDLPLPKSGELPVSVIYMPLISSSGCIGVLSMQSFKPNAYKSHHQNILQNIGVYTTIALENASAFKQIEGQKQVIEIQNDNIKGSIRYAQTIQKAILPIRNTILSRFEHFVLYRPKDIVSGDFYWFSVIEKTGDVFAAVVDCTGHGVPGAFMSMIGSRLLSEIINEKKTYNPSTVLSLMDLGIKKALKQDKTDNNDGMDVSLCRIITEQPGKYQVQYAGAKRPLYYYKQNTKQIEICKGSHLSIGGIRVRKSKEEKIYTSETIELQKGDMLYLSSDGLVDQNAPDRKKFGSLRLIELFNEIAPMEPNVQKEKLETTLDDHQQDSDQRDDITVFGLRL